MPQVKLSFPCTDPQSIADQVKARGGPVITNLEQGVINEHNIKVAYKFQTGVVNLVVDYPWIYPQSMVTHQFTELFGKPPVT